MKIKCKLDKLNPASFIHDYLQSCGIENVDSYIHAGDMDLESPSRYLNIDEAAERLHQTICSGERVSIIQDVDVDGVCSATITYQFLAAHGITPIMLFHSGKQHGINDLLDEIQNLDLDLLIVPDAGSSDVDACMALKSAGCDVLIADHHEIEKSNPYAIVVNCMMSDKTNHDASGTTVMAKVVERCCELYGYERMDFNDLIALSLIADSRSMISIENRAYLNLGMEEIK